jgi:hypothetical protein
MISRHYTLQRRCSRQLCTKYATRQLVSSSFSGGLGSRLLKTAEKDPALNPADNNQPPKNPIADPPKRVSIFSRPASSIPAQNGGMQNVGPYGNLSSLNKTATDPAKPRFSLNVGIQNNGLRRPAGSLWRPIPGTATNLGAVAAVSAAAAATAVNKPTGLEGQSSIRDFARQVIIKEKIDAVAPRDTVIVTGAKGIFTQQEVEDMKNDYDPTATPMSTAGQMRADVLGMDLTEEDSDEDDDQPREELTTGEIRYWKYQVLLSAASLPLLVPCR